MSPSSKAAMCPDLVVTWARNLSHSASDSGVSDTDVR